MKTLIVGRDADCDVRVPMDDTRVSRKHARVTVLGGGQFEIEDLNSANGIQINGQHVRRGRFGASDRVTFGTFVLDVARLGAGPRPPQPAPGSDWVRIGRDTSCEVRMPRRAPGVSRVHARARRIDEYTIEIEDCNSGSGVLVDGQRVRQARVSLGIPGRPGNHVTLGSHPLDIGRVLAATRAPPRPGPITHHVPPTPIHTPPTPLPPPGPVPRSSGFNPLMVAVAAAIGLFLFIGLSRTGGIGGVFQSREVVSAEEAYVRVAEAVTSAPDLAEHLRAYEELGDELEPFRDAVALCAEVARGYEELKTAEVFGVRIWDAMRDAYSEIKLLEAFADALSKLVREAPAMMDQLAALPFSAQKLADRFDEAERAPSATSIAALEGSLGETEGAMRSVHRALEGPRDAVLQVNSRLKSVESGLKDFARSMGSGRELLEELASGLRALRRPIEKMTDGLGEIRGALDADAQALATTREMLNGLTVR